jgi:hypothetical protein
MNKHRHYSLTLRLALIFALPGGEAISRYFLLVTISVLALVILASLIVVVIAFLRPRGRR